MIVDASELESSLSSLQFLVCRDLVLHSNCAMIIGGAIRDFYFKYPIDDVDFIILEENPLKGIQVVLEVLGASTEVTSVKVHTPLTPYRTAKIELSTNEESLVFDIGFPRKEKYQYPAAKPEVAPGSFEEDILRRDFSMNALCVSGEEGKFKLFDLVDGFKDIENKNLRILHPESFRDDPIRLVRGVRFMHRYACSFDVETKKCSQDPELHSILAAVSEGRRVQEFYKILFEADPFKIIEDLARKGFLELLFPGLEKNMPRRDVYEEFSRSDFKLPGAHILLAFLMKNLEPSQAKHLMQYIPISKEERKLVFSIV